MSFLIHCHMRHISKHWWGSDHGNMAGASLKHVGFAVTQGTFSWLFHYSQLWRHQFPTDISWWLRFDASDGTSWSLMTFHSSIFEVGKLKKLSLECNIHQSIPPTAVGQWQFSVPKDTIGRSVSTTLGW